MFTKLYRDTTQPGIRPWSLLRDNRVYISAAVHTVLYLALTILISQVFRGRGLKPSVVSSFIIVSMLIQILGYPARAWHVNEIYNAYDKDNEGAREHVDKCYITWFFMG